MPVILKLLSVAISNIYVEILYVQGRRPRDYVGTKVLDKIKSLINQLNFRALFVD